MGRIISDRITAAIYTTIVCLAIEILILFLSLTMFYDVVNFVRKIV